MNDQERMTDFLCSEKKMTSNYDTYASECVNIPLRDAFLGLFNQGHHTQTELFQLAQSKGWYQPEPGPGGQDQPGLHQVLQPEAHRTAVRPERSPRRAPSAEARRLGPFSGAGKRVGEKGRHPLKNRGRLRIIKGIKRQVRKETDYVPYRYHDPVPRRGGGHAVRIHPGPGQERGYIRIECHQIRDYTLNKQRQVDDYPYGGGRGAVMQADPLYQCWKHICEEAGEPGPYHLLISRRQDLPARGMPAAEGRLPAADPGLRALRGDRRAVRGGVRGRGDLPGGLCAHRRGDPGHGGGGRGVPAGAGVLSDPECYENESHWNGALEAPQYSRPEVWHERAVPPILLSGNHAKVDQWRRKQSILRTRPPPPRPL